MRTTVILALILSLSRIAVAAGGFEIDEQSARGVATAGAQTAVANDPAANFYNPAGLVFQPGFGALAGGNLIYTDTRVTTDAPMQVTQTTTATHVAFAPVLFLSQRIGRHVAFGLGVFTQFGEHFGYPTNWPGRFIGQFIDVTTATFNLNVAIRILPHVSLAAGLDVIPASLDLYRAVNFGGAEGSVHIGVNAIGVGGNAALLVDLVPGHFRFGFSYRSRVDLDFDGHGAISAPVELRSQTGGLLDARTSLPLPHNIGIGVAVDPIKALTLDADVRITLWRDISTLTLTLTDPQAPPGTPATQDQLSLQSRNAWAIRVGGELRLLGGRLHLRLGGGYDSTPVPAQTLGPLIPDAQRGLLGGGIGWHTTLWAVDLGYMAVFLLDRTSANPDLLATYRTFGHVISASVTFRYPRVASKVRAEPPPEEPQ